VHQLSHEHFEGNITVRENGNIQDQVGQGSEQPDLVSGVPTRCGGIGLDDL